MIKKVKKTAIGVFAGCALLVTIALPAVSNDRVAAALTASRDSNNVVTATPRGMRLNGTEENALSMWLSGNNVTFHNGLARNNPLWGYTTRATQYNPRRNHLYAGAQRQATIRQGYAQGNARVRRTASANWSVTSTTRRTFN